MNKNGFRNWHFSAIGFGLIMAACLALAFLGCSSDDPKVNPVVTVDVTPKNQSVTRGKTLQFYAEVKGTNNQAVTWSIVETAKAEGTSKTIEGTSECVRTEWVNKRPSSMMDT